MPIADFMPCLHCECAPAVNALGLCQDCNAAPRIRVLYLRRRGWTPRWEIHLRRLARRASKGLPLFGDEPEV
jgi:hypothetical protein